MKNKVKAVHFLKVGEFVQNNRAFIRKVTELVQFNIKPDSTYEDLYKKIRSEFKDDQQTLDAFHAWWQTIMWADMERTVVMEYEPELDVKYYAIFDIYDL